MDRRMFMRIASASAGASYLSGLSAAEPPRFSPSWQSLVEGYQVPAWFRDAKLGIWAHWSAQCVPEAGDWYARQMYIQGTREYRHHLEHYGHPADRGFMEIENLWKAENWDPSGLLDQFVKAGAKYFVALANHHDNFDAYDSKFHEWNSVRVGPRKDIVGTWAKLARARGLKFGVSNHSAHAWHWYQPAYGYDPEGARAGQRYDAFKLRKQHGRGTWWEGMDPQTLYTGPNMVMPDGITTIKTAQRWHEENDRIWDEKPPAMNEAFVRRWVNRCRDLLDQHHPDLLYFDNFDLPLGQVGLDIAAYFYNASMGWNRGALEGVLNVKMVPAERRAGLVEDVERGFRESIEPLPWQTDTCIGDWHYNRSHFINKSYKSAKTVIQRLCDIVSKNGNLLLSIPMRGDGTIDSEENKVLVEMAEWISVNGEAIYGTRPWRTYGEGPTREAGGMFGEGKNADFTPEDVRFTSRNGTLYAIAFGRSADGALRIGTLGSESSIAPGSIDTVHLVGSGEALPFTRDRRGLRVQIPEGMAGVAAVSVAIRGQGVA